MMSAKQLVSPSAIVARERWMQLLSAALTAGGALGLAACYGPGFFRSNGQQFVSSTRPNRIPGRRHGAVV
jgi:hypothetical protein